MNRYVWGLLTIIVFTTSELLGKALINMQGTELAEASMPAFVSVMVRVPLMWLALLLRGAGLVLWYYVLSKFRLYEAYGLLSLMYVLMFLGAWKVLGEPLTAFKSTGCLLIALGVLLLGR